MKALKAGIAFLMILLMANMSFAQCGRVPLQDALDAMVSDSEVSVTQVSVPSWPDRTDGVYNPKYYYEFTPVGMTPQDGFIIYPGGDVDERAYAVMARSIAKAGFMVALVPMPGCVAIYGINRADAVIDNNPDITTWTIGGHSFGGVGACWYVTGTFTHNSKIKGVVLWASYPADSLASKPVKVISIWGAKDAFTTETVINSTKPKLPSDTYYIKLTGANHTQFGWYGLSSDDYDYLSLGSDGVTYDNPADISRQQQHDLILSWTLKFFDSLSLPSGTTHVPEAVSEIEADDGSIWEGVSLPGLGDRNNTDIVALTPYKGSLYALTRNDVSGFEIWKSDATFNWVRLHVTGFTDQSGYYGYLQNFQADWTWGPSLQYNPNMNIWADMIEFKDRLYVAVSTGYQGSALFGSRGCLIWRTDGAVWEPVIGGKGPVAKGTGTLTTISSCANSDGSYTAYFYDSTKSWTSSSLVGGIIAVDAEFTSATHGQEGVTVKGKRLFRITANTATRLTVQQDEIATSTTEYTRCDEYKEGGGDAGRPRNNMPKVVVGAAYTITKGDTNEGFGDPWNKSIIDFEILNDELYASIGLNYQQGARVMKTSDGLTWAADSPYSFGNIHGKDWHDGSDLVTCPDASTTRGTPVSSSATKMVKTSVTGEETLLIGGTGTGGCNGRGARIYRRDGSNVWTPIVDVLVDANTTGSNENGFGYDSGGDFFRSAFQAWSWVEYQDTLLLGVAKLEGGGMIYSTPDAAEADGAWAFSMGGADNTVPVETSPNPALNGFGDVLNTGIYLHNYNNTIYAGTLVTNQSIYYTEPINGADMWKGTGIGDDIAWTRVVGDGFGDSTVLQFQSFADYSDKMYMVASTVNSSNFRGNEPTDYTGAVVYRLAEEAPECLNNEDCSEGYACAEGVCEQIPDDPPALGDGPFVAAGWWPLLSTSSVAPTYFNQNYSVLWTFSDDFAACEEDCTHSAEYQIVGAETWTTLAVSSDAEQGFAWVDLPITGLQNATTYAFRYSVTDCASQTTQSGTYYFRVAVTDAPPVITSAPFVVANTWPALSTSASRAFVLDQNYNVLWTFSDDYASCSGLCTHRARYRLVGDTAWTWITVSADPTGKQYAYTELPVEGLAAGTYQFYFDVRDCAGQRTSAPKVYYFKVE